MFDTHRVMLNPYPRTLFCAPINVIRLKLKYPDRVVIAEPYLTDDRFIYFDSKGRVKTVFFKTYSVWGYPMDEEGIPSFSLVLLWPHPDAKTPR